MTQAKPSQIVTLLGHDPQSKNWPRLSDSLRSSYEYLQRKTIKSRRESAKRYIHQRIAPGSHVIGAFPPIAIGVTKPLSFISYKDKYPQIDITDGVGILEFSLATSDTRLLLDGLRRVSSALELIEDGQQDVADSFTFGLAIYAPLQHELTPVQLGQLFHDFNFLATPVSAGQAVDLDQSDPHIIAVNMLSQAPVITDHGGVEPRAASLGSKSTALVAKRVLLRFVRGATEGAAFQHTLREVPDSRANLTADNMTETVRRIEQYLTEIATRIGADRFRERSGLHLTAPGWNALGQIFHDMEYVLNGNFALEPHEKDQILDGIAHIDWSRQNPDWVDFMGHSALDDKEQQIIDPQTGRPVLGKLFGGQQAITKLANYIREKSGLKPFLDRYYVAVAAEAAAHVSEDAPENPIGENVPASLAV